MALYAWLNRSVAELPGLGKTLGKRLAARGILCFGDLLLHFPQSYEDTSKPAVFEQGVVSRHQGVVLARRQQGVAKQAQLIVSLHTETGIELHLRFFHAGYLKRDARLAEGSSISVRGAVQWQQGRWWMLHPDWCVASRQPTGWQPYYGSIAKVSGKRLADWIQQLIEMMPKQASPFDALAKIPMPLHEAFRYIHQPPKDFSEQGQQLALSRLRLEEWLCYAQLMQQHQLKQQIETKPMRAAACTKALLASFPYPLTEAQNLAWQDIQADLLAGKRMHRLLQGDVGAGKTWLAALALAMVIDAGQKGALMAPTEVLAQQHLQSLQTLFQALKVRVFLLTGSSKAADRRHILRALQADEPLIIIGTHALISDDVQYKNLALAVIDEQHRFGVQQRSALSQRGRAVHVLAMSATPIPRSLALSLYGDVDCSVMRGLPHGRKPIITSVLSKQARGSLAAGIQRLLQQQARVYWIVPRIEDDQEQTMASVEQRVQALGRRFPQASVRGLHGRLSAKEKQQCLDDFASGACSLLVSTTVVEVGVNVPEACLIVIEHAERYGLAQLHQLRGRVGRSGQQSYCMLLPSDDVTESGIKRLRYMCSSNDGMALAEHDMRLRGGGDALGAQQSGMVGFRVLDIWRDAALIEAWKPPVSDTPMPTSMRVFWRPLADSVD